MDVRLKINCLGDVAPSTVVVRITDVGGQRAERKNWSKVPSSLGSKLSMVVFVAALSEYNQVLFEDRGRNRLEESLDLFEQCARSEWLGDTQVVLLLNKKDVFDKKFLEDKIPLNVSGRFPDAPKQTHDSREAIDWIAAKFSERWASAKPSGARSLSVHVTTATDSGSVRAAFSRRAELTIQKYLAENGLFATTTRTDMAPPVTSSSSSPSSLVSRLLGLQYHPNAKASDSIVSTKAISEDDICT